MVSSRVFSSGLSLIDLLLGLTLLATITLLAIPGLNKLYHKSMADHSARQLLAALQATRSAAVHNKQLSALCPTQNSETCSKKWEGELMIFIDQNHNGKRNKNEKIISLMPGLSPGSRLVWKAFRNPKYYIQYRPDGSSNYHNGTFTYCPAEHPEIYARTIRVNRPGRPRRGITKKKGLRLCEKRKR